MTEAIEKPPRLIMVPAAEHWPTIQPHLEAMKAEQSSAAWTPDGLLRLCEDKHAALFIAPDGDGYCVLTGRLNTETGSTQMAVLAARGKVETEDYQADLLELARVIGASEIVDGETGEVIHRLDGNGGKHGQK